MADTKVRLLKATSLLRDDHRKVRKLLASYEELEEGNTSQKKELFATIKKELEIHSQIEEEIFYPAIAMAADKDAKLLVMEAQEEHAIVKTLLGEIDALDSNEPAERDAKMKILKGNVLRHAQEEERKIFPVFDDLGRDLKAKVAEQLLARKKELAGDGEDNPEEFEGEV